MQLFQIRKNVATQKLSFSLDRGGGRGGGGGGAQSGSSVWCFKYEHFGV